MIKTMLHVDAIMSQWFVFIGLNPDPGCQSIFETNNDNEVGDFLSREYALLLGEPMFVHDLMW